jgi:hypothetical protein
MKSFLFGVTAVIIGWLIQASLTICHWITYATTVVCNAVNSGLKAVGDRLLRWIDAERHDYINAAMGQRHELMELGLLMAANQLRDDALAGRVWTSNHTIALNNIAQGLHQSCGWEPVRVHGYLRPLVEGIGVGYTAGGEDEEPPAAIR